MPLDYYKIHNYSKNGELNISRKIFEKIATEATLGVKGVYKKEEVENKKKNTILDNRLIAYLFRPIRITFHKNGYVDVDIAITLNKGVNAKEVCEKIQKEVSESLFTYTESITFNINIRVIEFK